MLRQIVSYNLVLLVLCSQVVLPVFSHVCHGMGRTWTSVFKQPDSCCKNKVKPDFSFACQREGVCPVSTELKRTPCCESHATCLGIGLHFVKMATKVFKSVWSSSFIEQKPTYPIFSSSQVATSFLYYHHHGPPVKLSGRSLLVMKQVFQW